MTFNGTMSFTNNGHVMDKDMMGGGVYLGVNSTFSILPNTTVVWENNHASFGGAIYVDEHNPFIYCPTFDIVKGECFFQLPGQNLSDGIDGQLIFKNNSADAAGSALYGGAIDHCLLTGMNSYSSGEVFDKLVNSGPVNVEEVPYMESFICKQEVIREGGNARHAKMNFFRLS